MHPAALDEHALLAECEVTAGRSSGPGGQNRNKVETAIRIKHLPTGVIASATERRHKEQNRKQAVQRLRIKLAVSVRGPADPGAPASACWASRVKGGRLLINTGHDDYPALLAEAMDRLAWVGFDFPAAAEALGVSTSQLVKLLKTEMSGLERVNLRRRELGMKPMH